MYEKIIGNENIFNIIILAENRMDYKENGLTYLYKYQSAENILLAIINTLIDNGKNVYGKAYKKKESLVVGIFSPIDNMKVLSHHIAEAYSETDKVLLMDFSFFSQAINGKKKLSDLFYYIRQKDSNIISKILLLCSSEEELNIISSIQRYKDLIDINIEDMEKLFDLIKNYMEYKYYIFNLGYFDENILYIMEQSDVIYLPEKGDQYSENSRNEFYNLLERENKKYIKDKCIETIIPYELRVSDDNVSDEKRRLYIKELIKYV